MYMYIGAMVTSFSSEIISSYILGVLLRLPTNDGFLKAFFYVNKLAVAIF